MIVELLLLFLLIMAIAQTVVMTKLLRSMDFSKEDASVKAMTEEVEKAETELPPTKG